MVRSGWLVRVSSWIMVLVVPFLFVVSAVRMVMTDEFLSLEYSRAQFPDDMFGFTTDERFYYASLAVEYLVRDHGVDFLAEQRFIDGSPVYNVRELRHMEDVQFVVRWVFRSSVVLLVVLVIGMLALSGDMTTRITLRLNLVRGSTLTLGLILTLVLIAALSWNTFFVQFHQLFFEDGTWRFEYSDTLIRLFPEQFWFDAALAIGLLTAAMALLLLAAAWLWKPQQTMGTD